MSEGQTIIHALWSVGQASEIQTGCTGGVCGACTVSIRFTDDRKGGTDLACLRLVEEGMEVFPYPVESLPSVAPVREPSVEKLQSSFPTLDRCTKCESCTIACPMGISVMESVLGMQKGEFEKVAEDFTTCIHCGLCRFVCEDKVKPHNMGLWVRRSVGLGRDYRELDLSKAKTRSDIEDREWDYLMNAHPEEILKRARVFRQQGVIPE